ncbi:MAG: nucleoside triphosphate pyrophosphohydrolase [Gemmatimonadota bacterium]|nr:nucleoside triphosphate pyrophosphohydrolase [Gemmatimonadota bacterium]
MQEPSAVGRIVALVRDLRQRCPWDRAQTRATLRPYLVEEVLELDHALGGGDRGQILEELGDVLLHVAFQIVLGEETGEFGADDLTRSVERKMWRRHPHLFGEQGDVQHSGHVEDTWEQTKLSEPGADQASVLDGLPPTLPPLLRAFRLQERAAGVGFDWPDAAGPLEKVHEEVEELSEEIADATSSAAVVEDEIGDLFFAVVNLARKLGHDPRTTLEQANAKFERRFRRIEQLAKERGLDMSQATLEDLDRLWEEVKGE